MKTKSIVAFLALALLMVASVAAFAQRTVRPYTRRDGTRVEGHRRTAPNKTERDNWSTKGNTNPDTGKKGTKTPRK